jgi:hypothetical protein
MPTNLNALIRYKTIDRCLGNKHVKWTIDRLREECSEALGESRGIYKKVSERTIRDDIRVMRSEILEFNAPIVFEDGGYLYSDPFFSIFRAGITDLKLLQTVFDVLIKNKDAIKHPHFYFVVETLALLTNSNMPDDIGTSDGEPGLHFSIGPSSSQAKEPEIDQGYKDYVDMPLSKTKLNEPALFESKKTQQKPFCSWSDILKLL